MTPACFGIALTHSVVAVIPSGFPLGQFRPVAREPVETNNHFKHWGGAKPGFAAPAT